jgi:hypothetical protein
LWFRMCGAASGRTVRAVAFRDNRPIAHARSGRRSQPETRVICGFISGRWPWVTVARIWSSIHRSSRHWRSCFATWFTYTAMRRCGWWSPPTSPVRGCTPELYSQHGPAFNAVPFNPMSVVGTNVGTATFTFTNGNSATFAYTVNGVSQTKTVTREIFGPPGTVCQ